METILNHIKTSLEAITVNTGTEEEPVLVRLIKTVEVDDGQLDGKVTLQLPAAIYDITDMAYSQSGEHVGLADTEITVRLAVRKGDSTRYNLINLISKALVGSHGANFGAMLKESQRKVSYDDIFEYRITFGCVFYDLAAVPEFDTLEGDDRPAGVINYSIKKPGS